MTERKNLGKNRGSIAVNTVIFFSVAAILLIGLELGYAYYIKREFQKVSDLSALSGAQTLGNDATAKGCTDAAAASKDIAQANLAIGIMSIRDAQIATTPGRWTSAGGFVPNLTNCNAVSISISKKPDSLFSGIAGYQQNTIQASAIAAQAAPQAALNIKSALLTIDASRSAILNPLVGGLLGGSLTLDVVSWQSLLDTNINLLSYLDQLATNLNISAGDYQAVLSTSITTSQFLSAAIDVLSKNSTAAAAVTALTAIRGSIIASPANLKLAPLINLQTGTPSAALNLEIQSLQLIEGMAQLANFQSGATIDAILKVPLGTDIAVKFRAIEQPQISAIGNPALASIDEYGVNQISVHTAQIKTLISIDASTLTSTVTQLLNIVLGTLSPVLNFTNSVLSLNLAEATGNFLGGLICPVPLIGTPCGSREVIYAKAVPSGRIDINVNAASGKAHVRNFTCSSATNKTLTVPAETAALEIRVGQMGATASEAGLNALGSADPAVTATSLITVGKQTAKPDSCLIGLCSGLKWKKGSTWITDRDSADFTSELSFGLNAINTKPGKSTATLYYAAPTSTNLPEINELPYYQTISSKNLVDSLSSALSSVGIVTYQSGSIGAIGTILIDSASLLNSLTTQLSTVVSKILSPLLDPIINTLLSALGINVAQTDVGARLSCARGIELVY